MERMEREFLIGNLGIINEVLEMTITFHRSHCDITKIKQDFFIRLYFIQ